MTHEEAKNILRNFFNETDFIEKVKENHTRFTSRDLSELLKDKNICCSSSVISTVLNTAFGKELNLASRKRDGKYYFYYEDVTTVKDYTFHNKNKNLLSFYKNAYCTKEEDEIIYDFNKNAFIKYPSFFTDEEREHLEKNIKEYVPEWIFSYRDLWNDSFNITISCTSKLPKNCPKGYINFLKSTNQTISDYTIELFNIVSIYGEDYYIFREKFKSFYYQCNKEKFYIWMYNNYHSIVKAFKNSLSKLDFDTVDFFRVVKRFYNYYEQMQDFFETYTVSESATLNAIFTSLENEKDNYLKKKISKEQTKYNFINNLILNDNYYIEIPQGLKDLQEEGDKQHNCVGHFYNDAIMNGSCFIYFIHKTKAPKAKNNYITCRFDLTHKKTVEARRKNNDSINSTDEQMINKIDNIINQNI